jgi:hypothetical protein
MMVRLNGVSNNESFPGGVKLLIQTAISGFVCHPTDTIHPTASECHSTIESEVRRAAATVTASVTGGLSQVRYPRAINLSSLSQEDPTV